MDETPYVETLEPGGAGGSPDGAGGSKLPPVLANLMGSMGAGKSPQGPGGGGINVQEILTSIMVRAPLLPLSYLPCSSLPSARLPTCSSLRVLPLFSVDLVLNDLALQGSPNSHPSEELLKQADYSDKIKQMLGNAQGQPPGLGEGTGSGLGGARVLPLGGKTREGKTGQRAALCQVGGKGWLDAPKREDTMPLFSSPLADCFTPYSTVPHGLLGPGPIANGFPPGGPGAPKGMQHFPPGPGGPMPGRWRASGWKGLVCWIWAW